MAKAKSAAGKAVAKAPRVAARGGGDRMIGSIGKKVSGAAGNNRMSRRQATGSAPKGSGVGGMMKQSGR